MKIFTWNVKNNISQDFYNYLNRKVEELDIHIIVLQEFLSGDENKIFGFTEIKYPKNGDARYVRVFYRKGLDLDYQNISSLIGNKLLSVEFIKSKKVKFTLVGVHYYSKVGRSPTQHNISNEEFSLSIKQIEAINGHKNTIVTGDFNYLPHDLHLTNPTQLNAINSKEVIRRFIKRKCGKSSYEFFYNPMWNLVGDYDYITKKDKVNGTFFWEADDAEKYYWNLIDGVIVNQVIMDAIDIAEIKIIDDILDYSNKNERIKFSDHLPVKFIINTEKMK